jgi:hypothetical protein
MTSEKLKKLHINISSPLHQKLRVKCALDNSTIQEFVVSLIADALKDITLPVQKKG